MKIPLSWQFGDFNISAAISTTPTQFPLMSAISGLLANTPQTTKPVSQNGVIVWRTKIHLHAIELRIRGVGSQATALLPADLYNFLRVLIYQVSYRSSTTPGAVLISIDEGINVLDVTDVYYDERRQLQSQAFDTGDFNVPGTWLDTVVIPIGKVFNFETIVAAGTSGWSTNDQAIWLESVSDSSAVPHPNFFADARMWFTQSN
jgi:hypothetical protein